jgi:hypothetical protein
MFTCHCFVVSGSSLAARFGDIDEQFPMIYKHINPTTSVTSPPQPSMPGKFQLGPLQRNDVGHHHIGSGHWELAPKP